MIQTDFDEQCKGMAELAGRATRHSITWNEADKLAAFIPLALKKLEEQRVEIERLSASVGEPSFREKIFTYKHLDPHCVENGCQSLFLDALRSQVEAQKSIQSAEKKILIDEIAKNAVLEDRLRKIRGAVAGLQLKFDNANVGTQWALTQVLAAIDRIQGEQEK